MDREIFSAQIYATISDVQTRLDAYISTLKSGDPTTQRKVDFSVTKDRYQNNKYNFETRLQYPNLGDERLIYFGAIEFIEYSPPPNAIIEIKIFEGKIDSGDSLDNFREFHSLLHRLMFYFDLDFEFVDPTKRPAIPIIDFSRPYEESPSGSSNLINGYTYQETKFDTVYAAKQAGQTEALPTTSAEQPWNLIEDLGWDREALKLWHKGLTAKEIAEKVNVTWQRVTNRISELRGKYKPEIVPYDKDRKKALRNKKS